MAEYTGFGLAVKTKLLGPPTRTQAWLFVNMEDYKQAIINAPSDIIAEKFMAEADAAGFTAWQLAELAGARHERWA